MKKIEGFVRENIRNITRFLEVGVIVAWLVAQIVPAVDGWIRQQGFIELVVLVLVAELVATVTEVRDRLTRPLLLTPDREGCRRN